MKIVWIASYPRSGNTLVRLLLHNYLYGVTDDTYLIDERIPDLHMVLGENLSLDLNSKGIKLIKSHLLFSDKHPHVRQTAAFLYILRNPRDVLLSNARYFGADSSGQDRQRFAEVFVEQLGVPQWREMGMGAWPEHIASWLAATVHIPHLFMRYEDLRADTANCIAEMIQFLGHEPDAQRVQAAVSSSTIEKARDFEKREKELGRARFYSALPRGASFVGEGRMGQSLETIGPKVEARFRERFGQLVGLLGYS